MWSDAAHSQSLHGPFDRLIVPATFPFLLPWHGNAPLALAPVAQQFNIDKFTFATDKSTLYILYVLLLNLNIVNKDSKM